MRHLLFGVCIVLITTPVHAVEVLDHATGTRLTQLLQSDDRDDVFDALTEIAELGTKAEVLHENVEQLLDPKAYFVSSKAAATLSAIRPNDTIAATRRMLILKRIKFGDELINGGYLAIRPVLLVRTRSPRSS